MGNIESPMSPVSAVEGSKPQSDYEKWELSDDESGNVRLSTKNKPVAKNSVAEEIVSWQQWFKVPAFYLYGFVYMAVRILVNVQSVKFYFFHISNQVLVFNYLLSSKCIGNSQGC